LHLEEKPMKPRLILVSLILAASCVAAGAAPFGSHDTQDAGVPEARPFSFSSLNTGFAIQGEFEGEYRIYPDRVVVRVTKADIRYSEHCQYQGRMLLSAVKFGLGANVNGGWKFAHAGQAALLGQEMRPGDRLGLVELHFSIPTGAEVDLSQHWLVAQMEGTALDVPAEKRRKGHAYAHSDRDIFTSSR
jgi:hypothetical protein